MTNRTLCFLVKGKPISEVLLGYKKQDLGRENISGLEVVLKKEKLLKWQLSENWKKKPAFKHQ
jgi:hypothetical protein